MHCRGGVFNLKNPSVGHRWHEVHRLFSSDAPAPGSRRHQFGMDSAVETAKYAKYANEQSFFGWANSFCRFFFSRSSRGSRFISTAVPRINYPEKEMIQADGRIRRWAAISEMDDRTLGERDMSRRAKAATCRRSPKKSLFPLSRFPIFPISFRPLGVLAVKSVVSVFRLPPTAVGTAAKARKTHKSKGENDGTVIV